MLIENHDLYELFEEEAFYNGVETTESRFLDWLDDSFEPETWEWWQIEDQKIEDQFWAYEMEKKNRDDK